MVREQLGELWFFTKDQSPQGMGLGRIRGSCREAVVRERVSLGRLVLKVSISEMQLVRNVN